MKSLFRFQWTARLFTRERYERNSHVEECSSGATVFAAMCEARAEGTVAPCTSAGESLPTFCAAAVSSSSHHGPDGGADQAASPVDPSRLAVAEGETITVAKVRGKSPHQASRLARPRWEKARQHHGQLLIVPATIRSARHPGPVDAWLADSKRACIRSRVAGSPRFQPQSSAPWPRTTTNFSFFAAVVERGRG